MGKDGDLWDDSALINAFDDAMAKYKKMHCKKKNNNLADEEEVINGTGEDVSAISREMDVLQRETDEKGNVTSSAATEVKEMDTSDTAEEKGRTNMSNAAKKTREDNNVLPMRESRGEHSYASESYTDPSNAHVITGVPDEYSYSQNIEGYNHLLTEYYELEEKRQNILQQLQPLGAWNYQNSGEGVGANGQWSSAYQEDPVGSSIAPYPSVICSCCPYACPYMNAPCSSVPPCKTCTVTSESVARESSVPVGDNDIVNTAAEAARRAISSMTMEACSNSSRNDEKEKMKEDSKGVAQIATSKTDLSAVFNAWYYAGFYTGKYLTEQSIAKK